MCDKHHTVYLYGTCAFQKGRLGNASFPLISLSSIIAESGIEFTFLLRQSIRALHADVDVVRSTGGGGSRSETVLLVHVNGTCQLSEGNGQSDAAFGKDRKKMMLKEVAKSTFLKRARSIQLNDIVLITQKSRAHV